MILHAGTLLQCRVRTFEQPKEGQIAEQRKERKQMDKLQYLEQQKRRNTDKQLLR
jgi:hypothetical protein